GHHQQVAGPQIGGAQIFLKQVAAPDGGAYIADDAKIQPQLFPQVEIIVGVGADIADYAVDSIQGFPGIGVVPEQAVEVVKCHLQSLFVAVAQQGGDVLVGQVDAVLLRQQRISDVVVEAYTHGVGQSLMGYLPGGDALDLPTPRISWQEPGSEGARWLLWHPSACNLDHRLLAGMGQQAAAVQRRAGFGTHQLENGGGQVLQPAAAGPGAWRNAGAAHSEQVVDHVV